MKLVTAVVNPRSLDDVKSALGVLGVGVMTVSEAHDVVPVPVRSGAAEGTVDFSPRLRLELLADDGDVGRVAEAIARWAATGPEGDPVLWVSTVEAPVRLDEGELAAAAVPLAS